MVRNEIERLNRRNRENKIIKLIKEGKTNDAINEFKSYTGIIEITDEHEEIDLDHIKVILTEFSNTVGHSEATFVPLKTHTVRAFVDVLLEVIERFGY